ncbi:MAG: ABC transporter permease [Methanocellales archaeon]
MNYIPRFSLRSLNIWNRNFAAFIKTYKTNFIPPFLEPLLFLIALGYGLGSYIGEVNGVSYAAFIAPALISISIMNSASFECSYGSYVRMHYQKLFDAMIATPVCIEDVIAGELLWGATKSLMNSMIILIVIAAFGLVSSAIALLILPLAFLGGLLFASLSMCFTAIVPNIDSFNYYFFVLMTPMFLFCGTFFPLSALPQAIQLLAYCLPLTHVVIIARSLTLGNIDFELLGNLGWILAACALLFPSSINLMKRRLIV